MHYQIGGHERDAFRTAYQRLQRGPLRLELFLLRQLLPFGDLLKLRVDLRQLGAVKASRNSSDRRRIVGNDNVTILNVLVLSDWLNAEMLQEFPKRTIRNSLRQQPLTEFDNILIAEGPRIPSRHERCRLFAVC